MSATLYPPETNDKRVTSWIPLTTGWPMPPDCSTYFRIDKPSLIAFDPRVGLEGDPSVGCAPSEIAISWKQVVLAHPDTTISLGPLTCPDYLHTVGTSVKDGSSTLAICCPSGYFRERPVPDGDCLSTVSPNMVLTFAFTAPENSRVWTIATTTLTTSSTVRAMAVMGWNIQMSIPLSASTVATPTSTTTNSLSTSAPPEDSSGAILPSTTSAPIAVLPNDASFLASLSAMALTPTISIASSSTISRSITDYGLSAEDKAGIGVGAGVVTIGLSVLIVAICIVVRKQRRAMIRTGQSASGSRRNATRKASNENPSSRTAHNHPAHKMSSLATNTVSSCSSPIKPAAEQQDTIAESQPQPGRPE
ncbi:hypothetical protein ANOM_006596 [Aspergillus nomiae NRRL 13137]|uniref:Uncharacterized protein n=1 Tax=Aspergillus nomiae NRRL (strain ATCC 15546 / NRRL 13137 / CBS 260.88 / M93) TaxID=1509407 RepID=A0A0L1J2W6_ASPN3|nr:uncharacterized protein ANOM_006596 [Aspergillus nomiae NRRL 13137]KNG86151.1 hypothetical protein ANOM_006596 [Aspergillus nomiae NRRL 13137]